MTYLAVFVGGVISYYALRLLAKVNWRRVWRLVNP